jgi:site-specific DNA-methyltransferase (adenine-specific)
MQLINKDCIEAMKAMPDNSVDSIVTDPPYELGFMGKSWDASGIAFNVDVWREALRVIKPGGHLIAFSGSRTYHRMAVAIEDAGFQIRDQIMWVYGSGFPKSLNISKAIQKADGVEPVGFKENENAAFYGTGSGGQYNPTPRQLFMPPTEGVAAEWDGWGTALKPAHEPMVLARKPLEGTVANNVLTFGVGGLNIDGSRVGRAEGDDSSAGNGTATFGTQDTESGGDGSGGWEQNTAGRFPANFIHDGSDEVVALFPETKSPKTYLRSSKATANIDWNPKEADTEQLRFGDSGSAARFFYCAKASKRDRNEGLDGFEAKVGAKQFNEGMEGKLRSDGSEIKPAIAHSNHHPTVKPTSLMQYLIRLVTPPSGIVLDPFMGSGSTGKACAYEGFNFIGIDQSAEYVEIARARIDFAVADKSDELPL